jgi:hypothetical protein
VDDEQQRRLALNEALRRQVNEGIERGQWPGEEDQPVGFRCECSRMGCNSLLRLSVAEYERVRANPLRFVMIDGHEMSAVEVVVERTDGYVVAEKHSEAGEVARETDPRPGG